MKNSQHDLLLQYKKARMDLTALHRETVDKADRSLLASMIGDAEFVVEWLETGREPESRRGVDRRSVYELTKVWDPEWFAEFVAAPVVAEPDHELTLADEFSLDEVMTGLSERERQCYVLHIGFGFSWQQVAQELGIKKASVRNHIRRAEVKIQHRKKDSF